jgi:biopolymer transport protein ExbB
LPVVADVRAGLAGADVLIDFTRPEGTLAHLAACRELGVNAVVGTTGFTPAQKAEIAGLAERIAIVMAPNMAVGVNVVMKLIEVAARALDPSYDIEIVETHHRLKVDAPSGTALQMGEVAAAARGTTLEADAVPARHGDTGERRTGSIGFASLRGGDIVGDHTVLFAGGGERIEITHRSSSRANYAQGQPARGALPRRAPLRPLRHGAGARPRRHRGREGGMTGFENFWAQGDAITAAVAILLLLMSVSAWVVIFWKGWLLRRVQIDLQRAVPAFWAAPTLEAGRGQLAAFDREEVLKPLLDAALTVPPGGTLEAKGHADSQLTRRLRDALHAVLGQLQFGQVLLASIGSTAPFIGLFGTVWGIYHALLSISAAGSITIEKVSGPVGEALVMTAAGLAVAIPAVLAYNVFGKRVAASEAELEGFAHDLREMIIDDAARPAA